MQMAIEASKNQTQMNQIPVGVSGVSNEEA